MSTEVFRPPVQVNLDHRGVFGQGNAPLFPPEGMFAVLGGREAVARLVEGLYDRIEADTVLRPAFNADLTNEREKVTLFFEAWLGGPPSYFDAAWRHGLKTAHSRISISHGMAGRWVGHFLDSLGEATEDADVIHRIKPSIVHLAMALVNRANEPVPGERLRQRCSGVEMERLLRLVQRDDAAGIAAEATAHPEALTRFERHGGQGPLLLLIAVLRGKARAAEELLRQGVDVNAPATLPGSEASLHQLPMLPITSLCGALVKRRDSVAKWLVAQGAQYDIFTASFLGDLDSVRELLDLAPALAEAHDPACDVARITPLLHAVFAGQLEAARLLLERGATVGANSLRLIGTAANAGQEALTNLLLAHGAEPAAIGAGTWVLYPTIAEKLLAQGANVNEEPGAWIGLCCTGNSGHKQNPALALALLRCGADVTSIYYRGRTALHCAAKAGFVQIAEALIAYGGDVNARSERGLTPLDEVETAGQSIDREPMRRLLLSHGAQRSQRS